MLKEIVLVQAHLWRSNAIVDLTLSALLPTLFDHTTIMVQVGKHLFEG